MTDVESNLIQYLTGWAGANTWVIQVFVVVFAALLGDLLQRLVMKRLYRKLLATANPWDDTLVEAAVKPLSLLIWIVGISFAADIVGAQTHAPIFNAVTPIRYVGVVGALAWFLVRLTGGVQAKTIARGEASSASYDRTTADALAKLVRASVIITATLVILQTLGFSISGVLAFGGIGGIAVGFAAKDLLANFFGGLILYLDQPFKVGDWIRSPDRDIEGTVEHIGWRLTTIRSFAKRPIYVPNATFSSITVENPSRMTHRRIYETIGIRYDDATRMSDIVNAVKSMLQHHPEIDATQTLIVNFDNFAPSSLNFFIYTFTRTTNWVQFHAIKQDVLLQIEQIIREHGAEIAFPTSTLHLPDGVAINQPATG